MCEEFLHALFVATHLKVHINLEIPRISVSIRPLQYHAQIIDRAEVAFANIYHYAGVLPLTQRDLAVFILRFQG